MGSEMLIAHLSYEVAPFVKRGGMADVAGALPVYLQSATLDNVVVTPFYYEAMTSTAGIADTGARLEVPYEGTTYEVKVLAAAHRGIRCVFLAEPHFFDRDDIYHRADGKPYADGTQRGAFFAKAAWHYIRDVLGGAEHVVLHDWEGAALLAYLDAGAGRPTTTNIIHNLQWQGDVDPALAPTLDPPLAAALGRLAARGRPLSMTGLAVDLCDHVVTVSGTYRDELIAGDLPMHATAGLFTPDVQRKLVGFVNGIDAATWGNAARFDTIVEEKRQAAVEVRARTGLALDKPLALLMCRLTRQKGIDLLLDPGAEELIRGALERFNIVVCGQTSEDPARIGGGFSRLAMRFAGSFGYINRYDDALGKLLFKAADVFLFPSLFEPCGLTQMYAMAQGTVPVARATGGLKDTIVDETTHPGRGTGFLFEEFSARALFAALDRAGELMRDRAAWTALMRRAVAEDHSWQRRVAPYRELFERRTKAGTAP